MTMGGDIFGAIVFDNSDWVNIPKNMSYKIRLRSDKTDSVSSDVRKIEWKTDATFYPEELRNLSKPGSATVNTVNELIVHLLLLFFVRHKKTNIKLILKDASEKHFIIGRYQLIIPISCVDVKLQI